MKPSFLSGLMRSKMKVLNVKLRGHRFCVPLECRVRLVFHSAPVTDNFNIICQADAGAIS